MFGHEHKEHKKDTTRLLKIDVMQMGNGDILLINFANYDQAVPFNGNRATSPPTVAELECLFIQPLSLYWSIVWNNIKWNLKKTKLNDVYFERSFRLNGGIETAVPPVTGRWQKMFKVQKMRDKLMELNRSDRNAQMHL